MSRRILVVDDDPAMVRTLCDILRLRGWDSRGVNSGSEAVEIACTHQYPFVLMDIMMPGMDGVSALKAMKQCHPSPHVVLMTAHTGAERLAEAEREGAAGVMTKPIDFPSLLALLN
ncbi:MAG TPA: response regulator [Gemmatimonadales bacterium]